MYVTLAEAYHRIAQWDWHQLRSITDHQLKRALETTEQVSTLLPAGSDEEANAMIWLKRFEVEQARRQMDSQP